ncbi:NAD(P)-dependent oxidoreductase [Sphingobium mellinum]|uniref:NAD(P)-dependent oxidoreductase n=1 Tax=Sphingobium mellinum TaxID=1387166 RepID=UPI0030EBE64D
MEKMLGLIGFGEAGCTFATAGGWGEARVYDRLTDDVSTREAKRAEYAALGMAGCDSLADAVHGASIILSLVTADQAMGVAAAAAATIAAGTLYCDLNSVAPDTKREGAKLIDAAGGHYVDVAVMAPVDPARLSVPLLVSGGEADRAKAALAALGFAKIEIVGKEIGRASSIKMIRSVMAKGIEALTAECVLAAHAAGVSAEVLASLDASDKPKSWVERADYNLDRMMIHGLRRAAEMEEVVKTLDALGTGSAMTQGTVERQRAIGLLGLKRPAQGLSAKIGQIDQNRAQA